jgi:hypothetical protein
MLPILDACSSISPAALAKPLALSEAAQPHVSRARNLHDLLKALSSAGLCLDAARLLLRALPKRYAVAWVCECFKQDAERAPFCAAENACIASVESWIADGSEATRRAASEQAEAGHYDTAGSWVAAAAGWSGGSLAPPGYAVVGPAEHLTADACFASLCLLAAREPAEFGGRLAGWLGRALGVFGDGSTSGGDASRSKGNA